MLSLINECYTACAELEIPPSQTVMVGDSPSDMQAGAAAGAIGRIAVNSLARADLAGGANSMLEHKDATHNIASVSELVTLLGIENDANVVNLDHRVLERTGPTNGLGSRR